jgi:hypothetical protein
MYVWLQPGIEPSQRPHLNLTISHIKTSRSETPQWLSHNTPKSSITLHTQPLIDSSRPELSTAGKVILITGGGSGIGPHITHALLPNMGLSRYLAILGRTLSSLITIQKEIEIQALKSLDPRPPHRYPRQGHC